MAVAAGHTSGATVGHWTRVGEGKMNQVAQHCLMISEGMGGGQISFMSVSLTWVLAGCSCVCVCAGTLQLIIRLRCDTPHPHPSDTHTRARGTMGFPHPPQPLCQMMRADKGEK